MTGPRGRAWVGVDHLRVFGPFDGNIADRLRAAQAPPGADAVTRFLIDTPLNGRPLLLATDGEFVGARISHALGDGRVVNTLLPALLGAAGDGPPPVRLPLLRALLHHFGRHPTRLLGAVRVARPPAGGGSAAWRPDVRYVSVRSGSALATIRAWRDRCAPGISAAAVLFAAAPAALARAGLPPKWPGAVVLVDCRRYLPDGARVAGNFSWGQYLVPDDATDPRAVQIQQPKCPDGKPPIRVDPNQ